jgi:predicted DNA-binding transcriptional regulator YafY
MPLNRYAAIRHKIIDRLIGNKYNPYPSKDKLRQACEDALFGSDWGEKISESTIEKDILYLKTELDAPIKYSRSKGGYYYTDPDFSLDLNELQVDAIKTAAAILEQFKGSGIFKDFESAINKILERVNISPQLNDEAIEKFVQFEKSPQSLGSSYLSELLQAIKNKQKVKFLYQKFKTEDASNTLKERILSPYLLKEFRNRWYIVGKDEDKKQLVIYALDRMDNLLITNHYYEIDISFDSQDFFANTIGITTTKEKPSEVILSLNPIDGKYLKSQPLHSSQVVLEDNEKECVIKLNVQINKELLMLILSLGEGVKVISPPKLVELTKKELMNSLAKYTTKK